MKEKEHIPYETRHVVRRQAGGDRLTDVDLRVEKLRKAEGGIWVCESVFFVTGQPTQSSQETKCLSRTVALINVPF